MAEVVVTCPACGEVQPKKDYRCSRCGAPVETKEERKRRLANLEQSRRDAERNDVSIQRVVGGVNGIPRASFFSQQFFSEMSNQMRRRYIMVVVSAAAILVAFIVTH